MKYFLETKVACNIPVLIGAITAFWFGFLNFSALYNDGINFSQNIVYFSLLFCSFWGASIFFTNKEDVSLLELIITLIFSSFFIIILSDSFYDNIYAMLNLYEYVDSKKIHVDISFHAAISESIKYYFMPSVLQDGFIYIPYHYGSHVLFGLLAKVLSVPSIYVYTYLYSQIVFSLLLFLSANLCSIVTRREKSSFVYVKLFILYIVFKTLISYWFQIPSPSYLFSIVLCLLFFNIFVRYDLLERILDSWKVYFFTCLFIMILSFFKISSGFIFTGGLVWYLFRNNVFTYQNSIRYFVLLLSFMAVFYFISSSNIQSSSAWSLQMPHWIVYNSALAILVFIYLFLRSFKRFDKVLLAIKEKKYIIEESVIIMFVLSIAISIILSTSIASNIIYFIAPLVFAVIFLTVCSAYENFHLNQIDKLLLGLIVLLSCLHVFYKQGNLFNHYSELKHQRFIEASFKPGDKYSIFEKYFSPNKKYSNNTFYKLVNEINSISDGNKSDYAIFNEDSIYLKGKYQRVLSYPFLYTIFTGLVSYGNIYTDGKSIFMGSGIPYVGYGTPLAYGLTESNIMPIEKRTLENIINIAKADGKKFLFYIKNDKLSLINLTQE